MMDIHRSYFYYESVKDDSAVEEAIRKASEHGDGFWKIFEIIRRDGHTWNHKKVYRMYKACTMRSGSDSRNDCQPE